MVSSIAQESVLMLMLRGTSSEAFPRRRLLWLSLHNSDLVVPAVSLLYYAVPSCTILHHAVPSDV